MSDKKSILLVDDDRVANFLSERIISAMGIAHEVQSATNGREALNILNKDHSRRPDVIILDLNMPIMDGFEFINEFRKLNIPEKDNVMIIVVTSSNNPRDIEKARSLGVTHYLTKPISLESIRSIIDEG